MAVVFYQGDTDPAFAVKLKNKRDGSAINLSGATVAFSMKHIKARPGMAPKVSAGSVTVTGAATGECEYRWTAGDLDVPGVYTAEFTVTKSNAKIQRVHVPDVEVVAKLAAS